MDFREDKKKKKKKRKEEGILFEMCLVGRRRGEKDARIVD